MARQRTKRLVPGADIGAAPTRTAVPAPPEAGPPAHPELCPQCHKPVKIIVAGMVGRCSVCHEILARGEQVHPFRDTETISLRDAGMAFLGLTDDDLISYLPSPGAGGVKLINAGQGVKFYTRTHGTLIYRLGMKLDRSAQR